MKINSTLNVLYRRGFDQSTYNRASQSYRVRCSQCAGAVISGVACHETGCPNQKRECKGCDTLVSGRTVYCEDCK